MLLMLLRCCGCQAGSEMECKVNVTKKTCCNKAMEARCPRGWIPLPTEDKVKQVLTKKKELLTAFKKLEDATRPNKR